MHMLRPRLCTLCAERMGAHCQISVSNAGSLEALHATADRLFAELKVGAGHEGKHDRDR